MCWPLCKKCQTRIPREYFGDKPYQLVEQSYVCQCGEKYNKRPKKCNHIYMIRSQLKEDVWCAKCGIQNKNGEVK